MKKASIFLITSLFLAHGCVAQTPPATGPVAGGENDWTNIYTNSREACFDYLKISTNALEVMRWQNEELHTPPAYRDVLLRYLWGVNDVWVQRGELRFIVIDEDGKAVDDATREVYDFVKLGADLEPRFKVTTQKIVGEQTIKLTPKMFGLEVHIQSMGHRSIQFRLPLGQPGSGDEGRMNEAHRLLQDCNVLPPLTADGPLRIVTPFRYKWEGAKENSDGYVDVSDERALMRVPPESVVPLVSSDKPGYAIAPKRGIYALIDRNGKSYWTWPYNPGVLLGLKPTGDYGKKHGEDWSLVWMGNQNALPRGNEPYAWVLVSEPTRRSAEEVRLAREQLMKGDVKRPPSSAAPSQ